MATFDYAELRDVDVAEIITEFGVAATIQRWAKGVYDVAAGTHGVGTTTTPAITVVIEDFNEREIDGTRVKREDKKLLMGGADTVPVMNDKIIIGTDKWEIVSITPIKPGNVVVLYEIHVRI